VLGVLVAFLPEYASLWLRILISVAAAVVGYLVGVLLLAVLFTIRAPYKQRDEARAELAQRRNIRDLIGLDKELRATRSANSRILGEVKERGLTGPVQDDQDPWVRGQNENLGLVLENAGFPELVPLVVLADPPLSTWEDVKRAAAQIDSNLNSVLGGELLADVRHLREVAEAEIEATKQSLPSGRLGTSQIGGGRLRASYRTSLPSTSQNGTRSAVSGPMLRLGPMH
jgi:hypothetical protein